MTPQAIEFFFSTLAQQTPHPQTELIYHSTFELLVAVMLSAQATDVSVNRATPALFKVANTPEAMLHLGLEGLIPYIRHIGLFRSKAKHLLAMCELLIRDHDSQVPSSREALQALPGVGRKTANVVLNVAFGHPTMAVDTHLFRVSNRTGLAMGKTPLQVEKGLLRHIPPFYQQHAHHWLILHGRYTCRAKKPLCEQCPVTSVCDAFQKQHEIL